MKKFRVSFTVYLFKFFKFPRVQGGKVPAESEVRGGNHRGETFRLRARTRPSEETEMFVHLRSGNERWKLAGKTFHQAELN